MKSLNFTFNGERKEMDSCQELEKSTAVILCNLCEKGINYGQLPEMYKKNEAGNLGDNLFLAQQIWNCSHSMIGIKIMQIYRLIKDFLCYD